MKLCTPPSDDLITSHNNEAKKALQKLYFLSDKEIEKHLRAFFKDLFSKIKEEK
jgi:hypothetical protein